MATADQSVQPLALGPADRGRAVTDEEFAGAEFEEPWRYELVGGMLEVMSPNSEEHDNAAEPWRDAFVAYKRAHRDRVQNVVPEAWVRIGPGQSRVADIAVYLVGERSSTKRPERVPELVVEVVSPGAKSERRDAIEKRAEYHQGGVLEYVLVDCAARQIRVLTHAPGDYQERTLGPGDSYDSPLLPGFVLDLDDALPRGPS